jgi:hypothetical protein
MRKISKPKAKTLVNFRLTEKTIKALKDVAKRLTKKTGVPTTMTDVVEMALRRMLAEKP